MAGAGPGLQAHRGEFKLGSVDEKVGEIVGCDVCYVLAVQPKGRMNDNG